MKKIYLIKYGELAIKGKNRYIFENRLVKTIRGALKKHGDFTVEKIQGRLTVIPNDDNFSDEKIVDILTSIFGIIYVAPVIMIEDKSFDNVKEVALNHVKELYSDKAYTFKVEAKRSDKKYHLDSMQIAVEAGAHILEGMDNLTVDVKKPEVRVRIEIRENAYIYSKEYVGPGGMPMGTNGKALSLLSGGIDSPVASWMVAKRGVEVEGIYFHSYPYTSDRAKEKVVELGRKVAKYTGHFKLHVVPFTEIQQEMVGKCKDRYYTLIMRRIMYKIAEKVAINNKAQALVTGESIGQVASQTMDNLVVTNSATTLPIFRPLIGMDKTEIIDIANKIDTFETSILPYEDCCTVFLAKHPEIKGNAEKVIEDEANIENLDDLIEKAIEGIEVFKV
ncbi:MAG: tRNA 4-thiouridine(8) synthase ThiI [Clostridia bacterium]|jgi:thiamine biosynthesis protein ThiI|nr:tRNA 4-thiouridine(8) synthase ThiI [Clostridia bacterium]